MDNLTTEQINATVDSAIKSAHENIVDNFVNLCEHYNKVSKLYPEAKGIELYFAAIVTAEMACTSVLKETLEKILCN